MHRIAALAVFVALAAPPSAGALTITQLPGTQGCFYMRHGDAGCKMSNGMQGANDVAVTPDGRFVYAVSGFEDYGALLTFRRNATTGALTQLPGKHGCISNDGRNAQANLDPKHGVGLKGKCSKAGPMAEATSLAISPDGQTIYVLGGASFRTDGDSITVFHRDGATGFVHEVQCWTRIGTPHCPRTPVSEPRTLMLTPDGRELIVGGVGITRFSVDAGGRLSAPHCVISGASYVGNTDCGKNAPRDDRLLFVDALASSPDGSTIYDAAGDFSEGQLVAFDRDAATGELTFRSCAGDPAASCATARALAGPDDVAVTPDGTGIYVAASYNESNEGTPDVLRSSALLPFTADPFGQLAGPAGCVVYTGKDKLGCARSRSFYETFTIALTPDGAHAVAGYIDSGTLLLLDRDPVTQQLTPVAGTAGCVTGHNDSIAHKVTGCARGRGMYAPLKVVVTADGRNAYLASDDGVSVFALR